MTCVRCREALSAHLDGEESWVGDSADPDAAQTSVDGHLVACCSCRSWLRETERLTRAARLERADQVPDLTAAVLDRVRTERAGGSGSRRRLFLRVALFAVAAAQWLTAVALLFADRLSVTLPIHGAHELGAFNLALAVGFAWTAWRPGRARAHLPLFGSLVGVLAVLTVTDLLAGHAALAAELGHLPILAGLVLAALLARAEEVSGPPPWASATTSGESVPRNPAVPASGDDTRPRPVLRPVRDAGARARDWRRRAA